MLFDWLQPQPRGPDGPFVRFVVYPLLFGASLVWAASRRLDVQLHVETDKIAIVSRRVPVPPAVQAAPDLCESLSGNDTP